MKALYKKDLLMFHTKRFHNTPDHDSIHHTLVRVTIRDSPWRAYFFSLEYYTVYKVPDIRQQNVQYINMDRITINTYLKKSTKRELKYFAFKPWLVALISESGNVTNGKTWDPWDASTGPNGSSIMRTMLGYIMVHTHCSLTSLLNEI